MVEIGAKKKKRKGEPQLQKEGRPLNRGTVGHGAL
jgi:hypothetical protein